MALPRSERSFPLDSRPYLAPFARAIVDCAGGVVYPGDVATPFHLDPTDDCWLVVYKDPSDPFHPAEVWAARSSIGAELSLQEAQELVAAYRLEAGCDPDRQPDLFIAPQVGDDVADVAFRRCSRPGILECFSYAMRYDAVVRPGLADSHIRHLRSEYRDLRDAGVI